MSVISFLHLALALVLAPLLLGVINRTKAWFGGRIGPPFLQTYYDVCKLLGKGAVYSRTTSWIFRAGPIVGLASLLTALLLVPFGGGPAVLAFSGDLVLFAYLLGLARFFLVIAALDTGSSFEGMGASREAFFSTLAEPALLLGLAAVAHLTLGVDRASAIGGRPSAIGQQPAGSRQPAAGSRQPTADSRQPIAGSRQPMADSRQPMAVSLTAMRQALSAASWAGSSLPLVLICLALGVILLVENCRIPFDDPNTHLELTMIHEVMVLDHSGPDLAFILYGAALKFWLLGSLLVGIVLPPSGLLILDSILGLAGMLAVAVLVGVVESTMARLRLLRVPQLLVGASALAAVAFLLEVSGGGR